MSKKNKTVLTMDEGKDTILILDDDPNLLITLKMQLKDMYDVITTTDHLEALKILKTQEPPYCFIVDYNLVGINGIDVTKIIRKIPELKDIPIILLSGTNDEDIVKLAYENGITLFLTKGIVTASYIDAKIHQAKILEKIKKMGE